MDKYRLLVVEDDESSQRAWHAIFSLRGWDVAIAGTVAEGLALLDPTPDYIILDLVLPDGEGEAILRKVRDRKLKTRVTVMTGASDAVRLRVVRDLNPDALFAKPIDIIDVWRESERATAG